jgi:hypothetical protein
VAEHSVFGGAAPPWEPTTALDDPVALGSAFYSLADTWWAVGGRIRIPAGDAGLYPATVTLELRLAATLSLVDLSTAPATTGVATIADGWCTAVFDDIVMFAPGTAAWVTLSSGSTAYPFVPVGTVGLGPVQASDASDLYLAEAGTTLGVEQPRSAFRYGVGATQLSQAWYGVDILVSDGDVTGDVTIAGAGVIVSVGEVNAAGDASLAASGALAAIGSVVASSDATLVGTGAVTAAGTTQGTASALIAGVMTISAQGAVLGSGDGGCWDLDVDIPGWDLDVTIPAWTLEFEC